MPNKKLATGRKKTKLSDIYGLRSIFQEGGAVKYDFYGNVIPSDVNPTDWMLGLEGDSNVEEESLGRIGVGEDDTEYLEDKSTPVITPEGVVGGGTGTTQPAPSPTFEYDIEEGKKIVIINQPARRDEWYEARGWNIHTQGIPPGSWWIGQNVNTPATMYEWSNNEWVSTGEGQQLFDLDLTDPQFQSDPGSFYTIGRGQSLESIKQEASEGATSMESLVTQSGGSYVGGSSGNGDGNGDDGTGDPYDVAAGVAGIQFAQSDDGTGDPYDFAAGDPFGMESMTYETTYGMGLDELTHYVIAMKYPGGLEEGDPKYEELQDAITKYFPLLGQVSEEEKGFLREQFGGGEGYEGGVSFAESLVGQQAGKVKESKLSQLQAGAGELGGIARGAYGSGMGAGLRTDISGKKAIGQELESVTGEYGLASAGAEFDYRKGVYGLEKGKEAKWERDFETFISMLPEST